MTSSTQPDIVLSNLGGLLSPELIRFFLTWAVLRNDRMIEGWTKSCTKTGEWESIER